LVVPSGPDVLVEVFNGEAVVVHLTTGVYYSFDAAATALWQALVDAAPGEPLSDEVVAFRSYLVTEQLASTTEPVEPDGAGWPGVDRFTDMADLLVLDPIHDIDLDGSGWPIVDPDRAAS
jgi:hypothetical protein